MLISGQPMGWESSTLRMVAGLTGGDREMCLKRKTELIAWVLFGLSVCSIVRSFESAV